MNTYIVIDVLFLIAVVILLFIDDNVPWRYVAFGFITGMSLHEILIFIRDRQSKTRKLR
ncbi:MAG: hypothetical protein IJQ85_09000 [Selenomonadaceae bacterium]|nr:hypothetical protein [Selenomonadaceae bacterium]